MIKQSNANVVCLQEVTAEFLRYIFADGFIQGKYTHIGLQQATTWYGVLILSEWAPANIYELPYAVDEAVKADGMKAVTYMGRACLLAEYYLQVTNMAEDGSASTSIEPFYVATSHFESLESPINRQCRLNQLHDVFGNLLVDQPNCCVVGDYNFDNQSVLDTGIRAHGFDDVILSENIGILEDFSFTMPDSTKFKAWRPDKICVPSANPASIFEPVDAQRVGWFSVPPYQEEDPASVKTDDVVRTPSDHQGLIVDLQLKI